MSTRTAGTSIVEVATAADRLAFEELPLELYRHDPRWVAPLRAEHRRELDPDHNPFFEHGEAAYFLALRDGRVVGRISAHVDHRYNAFHAPDATGFFGFFECTDDTASAAALFDAASAWLASRGMTTMVGPASFTLNHIAGCLLDGFDRAPVVLMSYNPPYHAALYEGAGFEKAQDLWAYRLDATAEIPAEIAAFAATAETDGFSFRTMRKRDYWAEVERFAEVYNEAWERNWGFVPMTPAEMRDLAKRLRLVVDPSLIFIAERDGQTAAVGLTLPDVNEELVRYRGRLGLRGTARLLYRLRRHRWTACRVVALGVKRQYRESGVGAHLYVDTLRAAREAGFSWGEMSWILESNDAMNSGIRHMGGAVYKTYRMYARDTAA